MTTNNSFSSEQFSEFNKKLYDKEWRKSLRADPRAILKAESFSFPDDCEIVVMTNNKQTIYLPLGNSPVEMDDTLHLISAAGSNTIGTGGTASTVGCLCDTASSIFCASTAGSVNMGQ